MHDVLTIGIPLLAILAGILFNRSEAKEIRAEMRDLRGKCVLSCGDECTLRSY